MKDRGRVAECGETSLCCRLFSKHLGVHVEVGALEEYEQEEMHQGWEGLRRGELQNKNSSTFNIFWLFIIDHSTFFALHWAERRTWWWWSPGDHDGHDDVVMVYWAGTAERRWWWSPGESRGRVEASTSLGLFMSCREMKIKTCQATFTFKIFQDMSKILQNHRGRCTRSTEPPGIGASWAKQQWETTWTKLYGN